jgi:hypothetical protein
VALDARLARVRAAMAEARLDALLTYTNNTRPAGVSWLTGFVPYWSEALLVVPREGEPVLVVALTYRVKSWIERTSRVAEVIHTPRIGLEAARLISATAPTAAVGIADLDGLSAGIVDDLRDGGPQLALSEESSARSSPRSSGKHGSSAPKRSISRLRPIWRATADSSASRARQIRASASRCAPPSPTRARGFASVEPSNAMARSHMRRRRPASPRPSPGCRASADLPALHRGWSRAAASRSRSRR